VQPTDALQRGSSIAGTHHISFRRLAWSLKYMYRAFFNDGIFGCSFSMVSQSKFVNNQSKSCQSLRFPKVSNLMPTKSCFFVVKDQIQYIFEIISELLAQRTEHFWKWRFKLSLREKVSRHSQSVNGRFWGDNCNIILVACFGGMLWRTLYMTEVYLSSFCWCLPP